MSKPLNEMSNEELWALFPVVLAEHDPAWPERYAAEAELLMTAVGPDRIARIAHIGSTAVPGLVAKPTIDILIEVGEDTDTASLDAAFQSAGYRCSPQPKRPAPHRMYLKGYTPEGFRGQVFHVHVRYPGDWDEPYFRDWLREHPDAAAAYTEIKRTLYGALEHDRDGYTEGKTAFVREVTALARTVYGPRHRPAGAGG